MVVGISIDYAATGLGHMDRAPSRVCLARDGLVVYDSLVAVPNLEDPMEAYTQISAEELAAAVSTLDEVTDAVRALLSATDVIVGTAMVRTVRALGLVHGTHFNRLVDLVERTRTWNRKFEHWNYYSLSKIAHVAGIAARPCNARDRAECAVSVLAALSPDGAVAKAKAQLQTKQYARQFPPEITAKPDMRVCTHAYNAEMCFCGQPTLSERRVSVAPERTEAS